jgi:hypothetical protein
MKITVNNVSKNVTGLAFCLLFGAILFPAIASASSPIVDTTGASIDSLYSVTLTGSIDTQDLRTTYWFELGKEQGSFPTAYPSRVMTRSGVVQESLTSVTPRHTYYYRLVARNKDGQVYGEERSFMTGSGVDSSTSNTSSSYSNTVTSTNGGSVTITNSGSSVSRGPSMATLYATSVSGTSFTMNGFIDPNGGTGVYRWFEWGDTTDLGNTSGYIAISSAPTNFSYTMSGLQQNRTYYFRAMGRNQYGISSGNIYSVKTTSGTNAIGGVAPVLAAQTGATLTSSSIQINGLVVPGSAPLTNAYFEWGQTNNLGRITPTQSVNATQATKISQVLSNLSPNTTYYYRVVAQDNTNQIYRSGIAQITTARTANTGVAATKSENQSGSATNPSSNTATSGSWLSRLFGGSNKTPTETAQNNTTNKNSGTAGVVYTGTTSGVIGWFFAIIFFIISIILGIALRSKNKKEQQEEVGFPEFPQEFHPQNIK